MASPLFKTNNFLFRSLVQLSFPVKNKIQIPPLSIFADSSKVPNHNSHLSRTLKINLSLISPIPTFNFQRANFNSCSNPNCCQKASSSSHNPTDPHNHNNNDNCNPSIDTSELSDLKNKIKSFYTQGLYQDAMEAAQQFREKATALFGLQSGVVASALCDEALISKNLFLFDEAILKYQQALEIYKQVATSNSSYATCVHNLGMAFKDKKDFVNAKKFLEEALHIRKNSSTNQRLDEGIGLSLLGLSSLARENKNFDEAIQLGQEALSIFKRKFGDEHRLTATAMNNLGMAFKFNNQLDEALPLYENSLAIRQRELSRSHPDVISSLYNLSELFKMKGEVDRSNKILSYILQETDSSDPQGSEPSSSSSQADNYSQRSHSHKL